MHGSGGTWSAPLFICLLRCKAQRNRCTNTAEIKLQNHLERFSLGKAKYKCQITDRLYRPKVSIYWKKCIPPQVMPGTMGQACPETLPQFPLPPWIWWNCGHRLPVQLAGSASWTHQPIAIAPRAAGRGQQPVTATQKEIFRQDTYLSAQKPAPSSLDLKKRCLISFNHQNSMHRGTQINQGEVALAIVTCQLNYSACTISLLNSIMFKPFTAGSGAF